MFFIFKQKTAYEMRISDWSSDVCSSDLTSATDQSTDLPVLQHQDHLRFRVHPRKMQPVSARPRTLLPPRCETHPVPGPDRQQCRLSALLMADFEERRQVLRSEEHTSELQSLMRNSYAVFCLIKQTSQTNSNRTIQHTN